MKLNRMKAFGKITGETFIPDGADRPAFYEQDGRFFDAHGVLIETETAATAGTGEAETAADDGAEVGADEMPTMTVLELLRTADTMSWRVFRSMAQKALGPDCPGTKAAIIEKLQEVQQEFDARAARKAKERGQPAPVAKSTGVDLGAWARGQREYLWGDVRKAVKAEFGRNVNERDDAVEFLIAQGVITAGEARRDVIREPQA